ncbi:MAG: hypothetical protein GEV08_23805 [Acidimicrobiia bacterium]|nr:hypothetical protein [Acidimicrobiia bacterium]
MPRVVFAGPLHVWQQLLGELVAARYRVSLDASSMTRTGDRVVGTVDVPGEAEVLALFLAPFKTRHPNAAIDVLDDEPPAKVNGQPRH